MKLFCETLIVAQIFKQLPTYYWTLKFKSSPLYIIFIQMKQSLSSQPVCWRYIFSPFVFWTQFSHLYSVRFEVLIVVTEKYCLLCCFVLILLSFTWPRQNIWWRMQIMMLLVMQCSLVSVLFLGPHILLRMLFANAQANVPRLTFIDLKVILYWLLNETCVDYKCKHLVVWTLIIHENSLSTVMNFFFLCK
jgi:hypothetical protein